MKWSDRKAIPKRLKATILKRSGGKCEAPNCDNVGVDLDHKIPVALDGENTEENLWLACRECHSEKTRKQDIPRIAKAKRQAGLTGQQARRKAGKTKKIASRGFTQWKNFKGEIVRKDR